MRLWYLRASNAISYTPIGISAYCRATPHDVNGAGNVRLRFGRAHERWFSSGLDWFAQMKTKLIIHVGYLYSKNLSSVFLALTDRRPIDDASD